MCLAQGPQYSDAGEARTRGLSVSSQALFHWATALPHALTKLSCVCNATVWIELQSGLFMKQSGLTKMAEQLTHALIHPIYWLMGASAKRAI